MRIIERRIKIWIWLILWYAVRQYLLESNGVEHWDATWLLLSATAGERVCSLVIFRSQSILVEQNLCTREILCQVCAQSEHPMVCRAKLW